MRFTSILKFMKKCQKEHSNHDRHISIFDGITMLLGISSEYFTFSMIQCRKYMLN